ncbi:phospholipid carrier-dependent glycosyltransferase [Patescibacteria group bacterium]
MIKKLKISPKALLVLILFITFLTRIYRISTPKTYYFDEVYHAFTAKAYADNDPRGYEWWNTSEEEGTAYEWLHPPISKLIMATSINIFGKNSFAWRLPSAIFGTIVVYLIYLLAQELFKKPKLSLIASLLACLDGLLLVQSRIAMNDIFVIAFMLASLLYYLKWKNSNKNTNLILSSLFVGLSMSTKWSGIFILAIIGFSEGIILARRKFKKWSERVPKLFLAYVLAPIVIYLLSFTQFFLQGHTIKEYIELHNQIILYEFNLDATHPYQSKAWEWPLLLKGVWYHVDYSIPQKIGNIYALSNPVVSWFGLVAIALQFVQILKQRKKKPEALIALFGYFIVWAPWVFSPRIMFYYHYAPAIPFLVILIAKYLTDKNTPSNLRKTILGLSLISFILLFPLWTGIPMNPKYKDIVFLLSSWK